MTAQQSKKIAEKSKSESGKSTGDGPVRVAIQGYEGSFHQVAAWTFFGKSVEVIPCATFREVVKRASADGPETGGVMAIENSIAGSILPNYNLLQQSQLHITGEVYLQINQNLLVNPDVKLEDIREVHTHPMALLQCMEYLDKYNWKLIETEDTALSAKHVHQHHSKHIAAIASTLAAELFDLKVIAPNIHTMKNNYTRFLILDNKQKQDYLPEADKASVNFHTDHSRGSLARVLTTIADEGINLSKLQSFPIPGTDFKYSFHADMEFDELNQFQTVINKLKNLTGEIRVLGVYKRGQLNQH
ncbi:prephenate dehydratase [Pollutibacter soli]|uniref:prephenate dehydratase n=1 Tax=Pollutibacter soli TaxID=3034157 RepID=UPI0030136C63